MTCPGRGWPGLPRETQVAVSPTSLYSNPQPSHPDPGVTPSSCWLDLQFTLESTRSPSSQTKIIFPNAELGDLFNPSQAFHTLKMRPELPQGGF